MGLSKGGYQEFCKCLYWTRFIALSGVYKRNEAFFYSQTIQDYWHGPEYFSAPTARFSPNNRYDRIPVLQPAVLNTDAVLLAGLNLLEYSDLYLLRNVIEIMLDSGEVVALDSSIQ